MLLSQLPSSFFLHASYSCAITKGNRVEPLSTYTRKGIMHLNPIFCVSLAFVTPSSDSHVGFQRSDQERISTCRFFGHGARCYSPSLRRFLQSDVFSPFQAGGLHPFALEANNAPNRRDPNGYMIKDEAHHGCSFVTNTNCIKYIGRKNR